MSVQLRTAGPGDADAFASLYNEGIAGREATFETEPRRGSEFRKLVALGETPALVAELDGRIVGCAWTTRYSERGYYAGILECSVYVSASARGRGIGSALCEGLATSAERHGYHKLLGKLFASNAASRRLTRRCGFREVGLHLRHGRLDGEWRDVLLVERLVGDSRSG